MHAEIDEAAARRRAVEAVIWGMPAVNFERMLQAFIAIGGRPNEIAYWSKPVDWKNQTLTPNPNTIYFMPFIDMTEVGPMVVSIPAADEGSITGTITDAWQDALEDVGPAGADKGRGARYLVLPPGYSQQPPDGYIVLRSATQMVSGLFRSDIGGGSDAEIARAVAYGKRIELYPLSLAGTPTASRFVDAFGIEYDATIPYDVRFFEALDRFVQREPWLERDKALIDPLESVGIEKGKHFNPTPRMRTLLEESSLEAHAWLDQGYESLFASYYGRGQWALPLAHEFIEGIASSFSRPDVYPIDTRGVFFSMAFSSVKTLGSGQFYLVALRDSTGHAFEGANNYRLTVPANVPVQLYWSATVYDRSTHALIRNQKWSTRGSSTPQLQTNADGSVDLLFGPKAPPGKEANWIPTQAGRRWEIMMRFYGPQKPLLEKQWVLPDVERLR